MKKVKMHSGCKGQEDVAIGVSQPPAPFCRCKKLIDYTEADKLVKTGQASWVITAKKPVEVEIDCPFCISMTEAEKKSCPMCGGSSKTTELKEIPSYNNDIVLLSSVSVDPKNKKYKWNTRMKTPRVATIEVKHIHRAVIENLKYAAQRIEEYRTMVQEELGEFGAELKDGKTGDIIKKGTPEPKDKCVYYPPGSITFKDGTKNRLPWWDIQGRKYDYGRTI